MQHRALRAIATCRTAALGGHQETCDHCGATRITYHSCRTRHCPKCQAGAREAWLATRQAELLPIPYFHVVFTLPHALNALAQGNPRVIYALLFQAAADTLLAFGRDPQHLGGTIGVTAILHTWGQNLSQHVHLHCLVTGGALAPDGRRWIAPRALGFLFPVRALATVFRGMFLAALDRAFATQQLAFAEGTAALAQPTAFARFRAALRTVPWVVYAKRPFAGPAQVLAYLGRYTHRVALTNHRLVACDEGRVSFRWTDYADGDRTTIMCSSSARRRPAPRLPRCRTGRRRPMRLGRRLDVGSVTWGTGSVLRSGRPTGRGCGRPHATPHDLPSPVPRAPRATWPTPRHGRRLPRPSSSTHDDPPDRPWAPRGGRLVPRGPPGTVASRPKIGAPRHPDHHTIPIARRPGHAASSNRVYPHGRASGSSAETRAVRIKPYSLDGPNGSRYRTISTPLGFEGAAHEAALPG